MIIKLTTEKTRRVQQSIAEAQTSLDKELAYPEDLQHADRISQLKAHIGRLTAAIEAGELVCNFS